jgi:hypothetical protein
VLRRYSQERNTKLRVVAEQLIETRTLPGHGEASTVAGDLSAQLVPPRQG